MLCMFFTEIFENLNFKIRTKINFSCKSNIFLESMEIRLSSLIGLKSTVVKNEKNRENPRRTM